MAAGAGALPVVVAPYGRVPGAACGMADVVGRPHGCVPAVVSHLDDYVARCVGGVVQLRVVVSRRLRTLSDPFADESITGHRLARVYELTTWGRATPTYAL